MSEKQCTKASASVLRNRQGRGAEVDIGVAGLASGVGSFLEAWELSVRLDRLVYGPDLPGPLKLSADPLSGRCAFVEDKEKREDLTSLFTQRLSLNRRNRDCF